TFNIHSIEARINFVKRIEWRRHIALYCKYKSQSCKGFFSARHTFKTLKLFITRLSLYCKTSVKRIFRKFQLKLAFTFRKLVEYFFKVFVYMVKSFHKGFFFQLLIAMHSV